MKTFLALIAVLGFVFSLPAQTPAPGKAAPGAKAAPAGKDAKKDEPPAKIEGVEIARGTKGFLGIQVVNSNFKLTFYDAKKKPVPADVALAVARWDVKTKKGRERMTLNPGGDPNSLVSSQTVKPPYYFKLTLTLLKEANAADDPAGESYTVDFQQ